MRHVRWTVVKSGYFLIDYDSRTDTVYAWHDTGLCNPPNISIHNYEAVKRYINECDNGNPFMI